MDLVEHRVSAYGVYPFPAKTLASPVCVHSPSCLTPGTKENAITSTLRFSMLQFSKSSLQYDLGKYKTAGSVGVLDKLFREMKAVESGPL